MTETILSVGLGTLPDLDGPNDDPAALLTALKEAWPDAEARVMPGGAVRLPHHADQAEQVLRTLVAADVWPTRLAREGESLESFFLSVIGGERA